MIKKVLCDFCDKEINFEDSCVIQVSYSNMQDERIHLCEKHEDRFASWLIRNGTKGHWKRAVRK